jgi:hypothetical protein
MKFLKSKRLPTGREIAQGFLFSCLPTVSSKSLMMPLKLRSSRPHSLIPKVRDLALHGGPPPPRCDFRFLRRLLIRQPRGVYQPPASSLILLLRKSVLQLMRLEFLERKSGGLTYNFFQNLEKSCKRSRRLQLLALSASGRGLDGLAFPPNLRISDEILQTLERQDKTPARFAKLRRLKTRLSKDLSNLSSLWFTNLFDLDLVLNVSELKYTLKDFELLIPVPLHSARFSIWINNEKAYQCEIAYGFLKKFRNVAVEVSLGQSYVKPGRKVTSYQWEPIFNLLLTAMPRLQKLVLNFEESPDLRKGFIEQHEKVATSDLELVLRTGEKRLDDYLEFLSLLHFYKNTLKLEILVPDERDLKLLRSLPMSCLHWEKGADYCLNPWLLEVLQESTRLNSLRKVVIVGTSTFSYSKFQCNAIASLIDHFIQLSTIAFLKIDVTLQCEYFNQVYCSRPKFLKGLLASDRCWRIFGLPVEMPIAGSIRLLVRKEMNKVYFQDSTYVLD